MAALSAAVMLKRAPAPPFPMEVPAKSMAEPPPPPCSTNVAAQPPGGGQYVVPFTRGVLVTPVGSTLAHRGEGDSELEGEAVRERDTVGEGVPVSVPEGLCEGDRELVGEGVPVGVPEGLSEGVTGERDGVAVPGEGEGEAAATHASPTSPSPPLPCAAPPLPDAAKTISAAPPPT